MYISSALPDLQEVVNKRFDVDYSYLRQYNETLGKISGNLNKIAKRINSTGNVSEEDMKEVKGIMDEVWRTFHNIERSVHNILVSKQGTSSDIIPL